MGVQWHSVTGDGAMGGELGLKARARAMARPSQKRKEVEEEEVVVVEDGRSGEKRTRLNEEEEEDEEEVGIARRASRPLPVQMGEKAVDLLALHSRVGSMGGYGKVTEGKFWGAVAEGLGLGAECAPGLKLVFVKYLKEKSSGSSVEEVGSEDDDLRGRQSSTSEDWEHRNPSDVSEDWYEGCREEAVSLQRDALNGMLEWIKRVALCPGDPSAGLGTPGSSQDDDWVSQCQMLTAKVRSVMWREPRGGDASMQAKSMPSAFYDEAVRPDAQALERLRAARERLAQFGFEPLLGPRPYHHDRIADGSYWGPGVRSGRQTVNYNEAAFARQNPQRKRIPIGPEFQADEVRWVPRDHEESGPCISDEEDDDDDESRWYGAPVWPPPQVGESSLLVSRVGRGRAPSCECQVPGSIHCVRVHIEDARERLQRELGAAWFAMGFDKMGEVVAGQWDKEEEHIFRLVARSHPVSKSGNFWHYLPGALPRKTHTFELTSYYFNVFMLRRRALQNRLNESKIDSDDDEGELPGESDDSEYGSTDEDEDEDEDEDDLSDGPDDGGSDGLLQPGAMAYPPPLKTPMDSTRVPKYRPLPDFNFSPSEHEVARIDRSHIATVDLAGNHIADDSHLVVVWDDKHLESSGSLVRDGVLSQEWQEPHWDDRPEHQQGVVTSSRQLSPPLNMNMNMNMGKDDVADVRQAPPALGDLWSQSMEMAPKKEKDRLLSTNGMIYELFGDDVSD